MGRNLITGSFKKAIYLYIIFQYLFALRIIEIMVCFSPVFKFVSIKF